MSNINPRLLTAYNMCRLGKPAKYPKAIEDMTPDELRVWDDMYKTCSQICYTHGWEKDAHVEAIKAKVDMLFFYVLQGRTWVDV